MNIIIRILYIEIKGSKKRKNSGFHDLIPSLIKLFVVIVESFNHSKGRLRLQSQSPSNVTLGHASKVISNSVGSETSL